MGETMYVLNHAVNQDDDQGWEWMANNEKSGLSIVVESSSFEIRPEEKGLQLRMEAFEEPRHPGRGYGADKRLYVRRSLIALDQNDIQRMVPVAIKAGLLPALQDLLKVRRELDTAKQHLENALSALNSTG